MPTALILASGGLDSTTVLAMARERGFDIVSLSFDYGQSHRVEVEAAARVLDHYGVSDRLTFQLGAFRQIGGSALTDALDVPHRASLAEVPSDIPVTYVPGRNLIFLSYAVAVAEVRGISDVFVGVNAVDYSGYPDCRPEFIEQFETTARLATRAGVTGRPLTVHAPLLHLSKGEIVREGQRLGVPWHLTHTCYDPLPDGTSCGRCDSCLLRLKGFDDAGVVDPIAYASAP